MRVLRACAAHLRDMSRFPPYLSHRRLLPESGRSLYKHLVLYLLDNGYTVRVVEAASVAEAYEEFTGLTL